MTKFEDNISPYLSFVEGAAPSSPAATNFKLYYDSSDHLLKWKNSVGTVTTIATGTAMTNPMTTKGDVILGDTGGTPTRLGAGTSGYVLTSNGAAAFPSWQAPGGGGSLTVTENFLTGDVSLSVNTYADGPSMSLAAGTYIFDGSVFLVNNSATWFTAKLMQGTTPLMATSEYGETNTGGTSLALMGYAVLSGTTTVKIQVAPANATATIKATPTLNATGLTNLASYLRAVKIA